MSKTLKIIAGLLGLVVVLLVLAAVVLPLVVDPNDYRDEIAARVEAATGRPMEIEGELKLSVIPWLGVDIGRVRLGNPAGFGDGAFLEIESASVGVRLIPLLSRRLEVSTLRLEGLQLDLVKNKAGRGNWEGFGEAAEEAPAPTGESPGEEGVSFRLTGVAGLEISDARIRYEDRADGTVTEARVTRFATGALAPGRPFTVGGEVEVTAGKPAARVDLDFEASVRPEDRVLVVEATRLRARGSAGEPARPFETDVGAAVVRFDLDRQAGTVEGLRLTAASDAPDGKTRASLAAPSARFGLAGPTIALDEIDAALDLEPAEGPGHAVTLAAPSVSVDLERQVLSVPEFAASADGVGVSGSVEGARIVDAPRLKGAIRVSEFSPRALMERLGMAPPVTADGAVLSAAHLSARYDYAADRVAVEAVELGLDDTRFTGKATIGLGGKAARVDAAVGVDRIDLDRYLPPGSGGEGGKGGGSGEDSQDLAFDWLRDLSMDAALDVGWLRVSGLTLTDVHGRAVARDGVMTIEPIRAALYGGAIRGSARLDARQSPAVFSLDQSLSSLGLDSFMRDLAGFEKMAGTARLDAKLETRARTSADLVRGLNGTVSFDVADAVYKGVNLWYEIERAYALVKQRTPPEKTSPDTRFREVRGTAVIREGVLANDDFSAGLEALGLTGKGKVDLAKSALDYRMEATVWKQAKDETTGEVSELAGARLPLKISGALASPSVQVDFASLLQREAEKQVLKKLGVDDSEGKSAEEALKEKAKEKLRKLLGGGDE